MERKRRLGQVRDCIRFKHYSIRTEEAYVHWCNPRVNIWRVFSYGVRQSLICNNDMVAGCCATTKKRIRNRFNAVPTE